MAIKRREPASNQNINEEDFINAASKTTVELNPRAARNYKSHTIAMNEYEYNLLQRLAEKYGQSHSGIIRYALKQLEKE